MKLIAYYIVLLLVGDVIAVLLGLWIETIWPPMSMPAFIGLYFLVLWAAWIIAVRMTEPAAAAAQQAAE